MGRDYLHKSFDLNIHLKLLKTAETSKSFENKNGHRAILTGLPNFLGDRVAAHTQATRFVTDHCVT